MFRTKVGKIKTHMLCSVTFSRKSCWFRENAGKSGRTGRATVGNIIRRMRYACRVTKTRIDTHPHTHTHAPIHTHTLSLSHTHPHTHTHPYIHPHTLSLLHTHTHTHTHSLIIFNSYCFSTTIVTRTRLHVTLYVHSLSCYICYCQ
jgi:hypothetical protein